MMTMIFMIVIMISGSAHLRFGGQVSNLSPINSDVEQASGKKGRIQVGVRGG